MVHMAIVSDDLTGANDTGVQIAKQGFEVTVLIDSTFHDVPSSEVIVVNTDSRAMSAREAYRQVRAVCDKLLSRSDELLFKKVDSTMRGNIGSELDAVYDVFKPDFIIVAPSYPANGRIIRNQHMYVHGVELHLTEVSRDPVTPVKESNLVKLIGEQTQRGIYALDVKKFKNDTKALLAVIEQIDHEKYPYLLVNSETEEEMQTIVEACLDSDNRIVWCGSAGLAEVLATHISGSKNTFQSKHDTQQLGPVLTVVGSVSSKTRTQMEHLLNMPGVYGVKLHSPWVLQEPERTKEIQRVQQEALTHIIMKRHVVLYSSATPKDLEETRHLGELLGLDRYTISHEISSALGEVATFLIRDLNVCCMVLTGGDTAKKVCEMLGTVRLELIDEIETGVPVGKIIFENRNLFIITKAGSFGSDYVLCNSQQYFEKDVD